MQLQSVVRRELERMLAALDGRDPGNMPPWRSSAAADRDELIAAALR